MGRFRLSIRGLALFTAVAGFDSAVLVRAYQHGSRAGLVGAYLVGFGLLLACFNGLGLGLVAAVARLPAGSRLSARVGPMVMLGAYLAVLAIPILAILFLRPGSF